MWPLYVVKDFLEKLFGLAKYTYNTVLNKSVLKKIKLKKENI